MRRDAPKGPLRASKKGRCHAICKRRQISICCCCAFVQRFKIPRVDLVIRARVASPNGEGTYAHGMRAPRTTATGLGRVEKTLQPLLTSFSHASPFSTRKIQADFYFLYRVSPRNSPQHSSI